MRWFLLLVLMPSAPAWALDTTEPFDLGFSDFEMYAGVAGLADERTQLSWTSVIGVGVTETFSGSLQYVAEADDTLGNSAEGLVAGLYWAVLDGERFDLDLYGSASTEAGLALGTELNLDFPRWGLQLTVEQALSDDAEGDRVLRQTAIAPLVRFAATPSLEILAAVDFTTASNHPDAPSLDVGVAALGANVLLSDTVELITEAHVHVPDNDETLGVGVMVGFVATVATTPR